MRLSNRFTTSRIEFGVTKQAARVLVLICVMSLIMMLAFSASALAGVKIYVDTSAIQARTDMTQAEKDAVIAQIKQTIKENLEEAFGAGNVTVTNDPADKASADRTVSIPNDLGTDTDGSGNTTYHWGEWEHGSKNTTVHLKNYMERWASVFKPGGKWDTTKLGTAIGTTASHELGHSYSAGHDDNSTNKMSSAHSATQLADGDNFSEPAKKTLKEHEGKPPCKTTTNYSTDCCMASYWDEPLYPIGVESHEPDSITVAFSYGGPMSPMFDFGWMGIDTDDGFIDGNTWGDFIHKSTMDGSLSDAPAITFFDGWTAHFVLRGREFTPYDGDLFLAQPYDIVLGDPIMRPDGVEVFRDIMVNWYIDADMIPDVTVYMTTSAYGPDSPLFSGFNLGIAPPLTPAQAKLETDGTYVQLGDCVVTATFPDYFYVESRDRVAGIRVNYAGPIPLDMTDAIVAGEIVTGPNGERQIDAVFADFMAPDMIFPLGMNNRSVGGGDYEFAPGLFSSGQQGVMGAYGVNNIGLLIRTWGQYQYIDEATFTLCDGSGDPIKCIMPDGGPVMMGLPYAAVTGICSCEKVGDELLPVILVSRIDDITMF